MKNEELFSIGEEVLSILKAEKFEAYFVGGCVRDYLRNAQIKDIDITTNARPDQVKKLFKSVIPIGIEHGTVLVRYKGKSFEITSYRTEATYTDKHHPDSICYATSIEEDLKRRDFTINALAMDEDRKIIDLFEGKKDLEDKIIRAVRSPRERFLEDPLRMIRALRFSAQLGFSIEEATFKEISRLRDQVEFVAQERITEEFVRLFSSSHVNRGIHYFKESKLYKSLAIFKNNERLIEKLPENIRPLSDFSHIVAFLHLLQPDITTSSWIRQWKGSNEAKREADLLVQAYNQYRKLALHPFVIYPLPENLFKAFTKLINMLENKPLTLTEVEEMHKDLPIQNKQELAIKGSDLINLFPERKPGPWIQELLDAITKLVLIKKLNNKKDELREWAKCHPHGQRKIQ